MVELYHAGNTLAELSRRFGPTPWAISRWVKQADRDKGRGDGGLTTDERKELARLRRENKRLQMEREILSKAAAWFCESRYALAQQVHFAPSRSSKGNSPSRQLSRLTTRCAM
jgi:transposase